MKALTVSETRPEAITMVPVVIRKDEHNAMTDAPSCPDFASANGLYRKGDYEAALKAYEALRRLRRTTLYDFSIRFCKAKLAGDASRLLLNESICICTSGVMVPTIAGGIGTAMTNLAVAL